MSKNKKTLRQNVNRKQSNTKQIKTHVHKMKKCTSHHSAIAGSIGEPHPFAPSGVEAIDPLSLSNNAKHILIIVHASAQTALGSGFKLANPKFVGFSARSGPAGEFGAFRGLLALSHRLAVLLIGH